MKTFNLLQSVRRPGHSNRVVSLSVVVGVALFLLIINLSLAGVAQPASAAPPRYAAGPDSFGYTLKDSDETGGPTYAWEDISASGTPVTGWTYRYAGPVPIGFGFNFYGEVYDAIYVSANGYVSFGQGYESVPYEAPPSSSLPNNDIALFGRELCLQEYPSATTVYYETLASPDRFVLQFDNIYTCYWQNTALTFQLILYATGDILVQYEELNGESTSYVGIENESGTDGLSYGRSLKDNLAIQYYYPVGVSLNPYHADGYGEPGTTITYAVRLLNHTTASDRFTVTLQAGNAWTTTLSLAETNTLLHGESVDVEVSVEIPPSAAPGDMDSVTLVATSFNAPELYSDTATLNTRAISDEMGYVAVSNYDYLAIIDAVGGFVVDIIDLEPSGCDFPWRTAIPPDGQTVWVSCRSSGSVLVIDPGDHSILNVITGLPSPAGIAFTQDGTRALIGSRYGTAVQVVDTSTSTVSSVIAVDNSPAEVVMHPYLPIAYAVHRFYEGGRISVVDTTSWTVVDSIDVGRNPQFAAISRDGLKLYVANMSDNTVSVVDTRLNEEVSTINIGGRPRDLVVSPDGQTLYVTKEWEPGVALVDTSTNTVQEVVTVDLTGNFGRPWGIGLTCDGSRLVVSNQQDSWSVDNRQVAVIETDSLNQSLIALPDTDNNGYPDGGARGLSVCPQHVPTGVFLVPGAQTNAGARGADVTHSLALYNFTGASDTFTLGLGSHDWDASLDPAAAGPLDHGASAEISITVSVPQSADWYATDSVVVTAESLASAALYSDTASVTTEAYAPPLMSVAPQSLSSAQLADEVVTKSIEIGNGNGVDLEFSLGTTLGPGVSFIAASTELYGYAVPEGWLRVIALEDDTNVQVIDLTDSSIIDETDDLDRFQTWDVHPSSGTYYKVASDQPVVAVVSDFDYCCYTTFIPAIDGGAAGKEFVYYHRQHDPRTYIFAIEDAEVEIRSASGQTKDSTALSAGQYWTPDPVSGVYHVVATGRIVMQIVGENGYSTVPATDGQGVGKRFYFATSGWGRGAVAVFAYEEADFTIDDLDSSAELHSVHLDAGEYWWETGFGHRRLSLESTGEVEVWAGDTEGSTAIEDLGDDLSFAGGYHGREYYVHSLRDGFVIFAPFDGTQVSVDGTTHLLNKDEYLHQPDCCGLHHIRASRPILVQTLGGDSGWNDVATYLGGVVTTSGEQPQWLSTDPVSGTVTTGGSLGVDVIIDAGGVQPGEHTASLTIFSNDPTQAHHSLPVTMTVSPTADMGQVAGDVTDAWSGASLLANVELVSVHTMIADPGFSIWAPAGTYTLRASANGYASKELSVAITAGGQTVQNIGLEPAQARLEHDLTVLSATVAEGGVVATQVTISNTGPVSLEATFHEMRPPESLMFAAPVDLSGRKILFEGLHGGPDTSNYSTLIGDLTAAGATVEENYISPIDASALEGYDVLWVNCCGYESWTFNELSAVADWLEQGGAVLVHGGGESGAALADLYGIAFRSGGCSYDTTSNIEAHPITAGVSQVYVDTCSYLTLGSGSQVAVFDAADQPHVVVHEQDLGKMVVIAGDDFSNWRIEQADNGLLASNTFAWLASPDYEDIAWLSVEPASIQVQGHSSVDVTVRCEAGSLQLGSHEAILAIEHNDPDQASPIRIPLTLTVAQRKVFLPVILVED